MKAKPYYENKTALTPAEKLRVAVAVLLDGFDQHKVAALMGVNQGRVAEAVGDVRRAIEGGNSEDVAKFLEVNPGRLADMRKAIENGNSEGHA